ncbi:hypothetical protein [Vagococcus salmoninarum]|uniref:Uncharacterized protein n=1 Tax=Vagococcus salmoninarum TaxID=2739 RepID=A0A429ZUQ2_9ENTE|nr:hypothetical protein [Vagococcus salmoninarum]MBE9388055.1 hypothetical protein [Vagococcus salmoninarum]RST97476.1 hypothetical protein CBF35_02070 [Vagococcus salmoninarum]
MKVKLTRKTGFFGMGSPLKILKNGQQAFLLNHDGSKEFEITEETTIQGKFSFLKSEIYSLENNAESKELQIKINPNILKLYMSLFTLIFILPLIFRSWVLGVGILIIYVGFVAVMAPKFYVIEEQE